MVVYFRRSLLENERKEIELAVGSPMDERVGFFPATIEGLNDDRVLVNSGVLGGRKHISIGKDDARSLGESLAVNGKAQYRVVVFNGKLAGIHRVDLRDGYN